MRRISVDFTSHETVDGACALVRTSTPAVRRSPGAVVRSFRELVCRVADLSYNNRWYNLLFRGQHQDYTDQRGSTVIYPSIYRPEPGKKRIRTTTIQDRFVRLEGYVAKLKEQRTELANRAGLWRFPEYQIALLQHYELCPTPLLDLTHSLRVAATFALMDYPKQQASLPSGYIFAFGMPHPVGSVSHVVDEYAVMVKLQTVCPPEALRPHFQEGWLVGRLPFTDERTRGDNVAGRLLAKYQIDNSDGEFWNRGFRAIPYEALLPDDDPFRARLLDCLGLDPAA